MPKENRPTGEAGRAANNEKEKCQIAQQYYTGDGEASALPFLPHGFDKSKKDEYARRRAEFVKAKAQLAAWIRQDRNPPMTKTAKLIAAYLIECVHFETGRCFPSHETIADHLGISDRQVRRVIPRIIEAGWISIVRVRRNAPTFYRFHAPEDAVKRIEEGAAALKQSREDRRADRRFPNLIEHEPTPAQVASFLSNSDRTSVSARPHFDRTSVATPDRTSASGEHLRVTPEIDSFSEGKEGIKVGSVSSDDDPNLAQVFDAMGGSDCIDCPFAKPPDAAARENGLAALSSLRLPPRVHRELEQLFVAGNLTPVEILSHWKDAA